MTELDERLSALYYSGLNDYEVAKEVHLGRNKLREWRKLWDIPSHTNKKGLTHNMCLDIMKLRKYGESFDSISKKYGVVRSSITRLLKRNGFIYDIQKRPVPKWVHEYKITSFQEQFLIGDIFGDGHIFKVSTNYAGYFSAHSIKQEDFLLFKSLILNPLSCRIYYSPSGKCISMSTWSCPSFISLHNSFYPNGSGNKTLPVECAGKMNDFGLSLWYMGDGHKDRNAARLTVGGYINIGPIIEILNSKFNNLFYFKKYDSHWLISISAKNSDEFYRIIGPYIMPGLVYKVPNKYKKYCDGDFSELIKFKNIIDNVRKGSGSFRVLLNNGVIDDPKF